MEKKTKKLNAHTPKQAAREVEEWRYEMEAKARNEDEVILRQSQETVREFVQAYIDEKAPLIEGRSIEVYQGLLDRQIAPFLGDVKLDELDPEMVQEWVNGIIERWTPITVRKAYTLLRSACTLGVDRDRLVKNPTRRVKLPKLPRPKINALTPDSRKRLSDYFEYVDASRPATGVALAFYLGMREGEVCGLRWKYVDMQLKTVYIAEALGQLKGKYYIKTPKTDGSERTIYYPEILDKILKHRLEEQKAECEKMGATWSPNFYVIGNIDGSFMRPSLLFKKWRLIAQALELQGMEDKPPTFHDLRKTWTTAAITEGVDVKTVSSILGHSSAAMTLNVYASADPEAKRRAAERMAKVYAKE